MISTQIIVNCIEELRSITKVNLAIFALDGVEVASTFDSSNILLKDLLIPRQTVR